MSRKILTVEQVRKAIYQDDDFDAEELERLSEVASSFIYEKTKYDFTGDVVINPLAAQAAILYVRQVYFGANGYNKEHDYSLGLNSLIIDLQNIVRNMEDDDV